MHLITYLVSNYKEAQQRFFIGTSLAQHGTDMCVQPHQVQLSIVQNLPQGSFGFTIAQWKAKLGSSMTCLEITMRICLHAWCDTQ